MAFSINSVNERACTTLWRERFLFAFQEFSQELYRQVALPHPTHFDEEFIGENRNVCFFKPAAAKMSFSWARGGGRRSFAIVCSSSLFYFFFSARDPFAD